jgi:alkanesulfonate monooxygenase SsuD/methylene tetrahydromethanopterin reductase-like flavin-dependent oxidoreductase (luciferase family)
MRSTFWIAIAVAKLVPNFVRLDASSPDIATLMHAMLRAREVLTARSRATSQEPTTECWWADISVQPFQRPHPPLWMMSRDPQTLEFCARNAINPGYFLIYPRSDAAPRYRKFLEDWNKAGWLQKPNIAYCTIVHVDETNEKAIKTGLFRASRAYEGFLPPAQPGQTFDERVRTHAKKFIGRGEPGASEIMANLFDPDYLMQHELVFIGSPETVAKKINAAAESGLFNTFMGEFNFSDLPESDLMRSIRLFGEKVIPALRAYEPF